MISCVAGQQDPSDTIIPVIKETHVTRKSNDFFFLFLECCKGKLTKEKKTVMHNQSKMIQFDCYLMNSKRIKADMVWGQEGKHKCCGELTNKILGHVNKNWIYLQPKKIQSLPGTCGASVHRWNGDCYPCKNEMKQH